jgi:hypothetical protein
MTTKLVSNLAMSYQLHIIRADHWLASESQPIALDEWRALIDRHPGLRPQAEAFVRNPIAGDRIVVPLPEGAAFDFDNQTFYLSYRDGRITSSYCDSASPVLRELASLLNAKLQGEEGESY